MKSSFLIFIKQFVFICIFFGFTNFSSVKLTTNQLIGKEKMVLFGKTFKLQKKAYFALKKMIETAKQSGVSIKVVSSYRSFNHQNRIWKRKYDAFIKQGYTPKKAVEKVKEYTAIPGTSRHHWGTDVDLSNGSNSLINKKGNSKFKKWMEDNAHKFGFYRVYTNNKFRSGYKYESWHYSYRNLSKSILARYIKLDIKSILAKQHIAGSKYFTKDFLDRYVQKNVLGINSYLY